MGGGGAMKAAAVAKLAGIGFGKAGIRGVPMVYPAEQSVRKASEGVKAAEVALLQKAALWDMHDSEFTDGGELVMQAAELMPRVVFDAVPSFEEVKAATTELKDAIDKIYVSSNSSQCEDSSPGSQVSVQSPIHSEKSCVLEAISNPSVPKHALLAFQVLSSNIEAQTVVASLARDPNVWNAVMQNPAVTKLFQSHQTGIHSESQTKSCVTEAISNPFAPELVLQTFQLLSSSTEDRSVAASITCDPNVWDAVTQNLVVTKFFQSHQTVAGAEIEEVPEEVEELPKSNSGNGFFNLRGRLQNLKLTMSNYSKNWFGPSPVENLSNYCKSWFGPLPAKKMSNDDANGNAKKANFEDDADGNAKKANFDDDANGNAVAYVIKLILTLVMVVLLKRIPIPL